MNLGLDREESPSMTKTLNLSQTKPKKVRKTKLSDRPNSNHQIKDDDDDDDDFKTDTSKTNRQVSQFATGREKVQVGRGQ
jgi:hypothetical protein